MSIKGVAVDFFDTACLMGHLEPMSGDVRFWDLNNRGSQRQTTLWRLNFNWISIPIQGLNEGVALSAAFVESNGQPFDKTYLSQTPAACDVRIAVSTRVV